MCDKCNEKCKTCETENCDECNEEKMECEECEEWFCYEPGALPNICPFETETCRVVLAKFIDRLFRLEEWKNTGYWFPRSHTRAEMDGMVILNRIKNEVMAEDSERAREKA